MKRWSEMTNFNAVIPYVDPIDTENNNVSVGDINIVLNEAKLENDADYEAVANKVGQVFAKELTKQGVRMTFNF